MNKIDRHNERVKLFAAKRAAEIAAAKRIYDNACDAANNRYRMSYDQSKAQMEREPNG